MIVYCLIVCISVYFAVQAKEKAKVINHTFAVFLWLVGAYLSFRITFIISDSE